MNVVRKPLVLVVLAGLAVLAVCLLGPKAAPSSGPIGITLALVGIVGPFVALSVGWYAERHRRLARLLERLAKPAVLGNMPVGLVDGVGPACVAGLRRPRIYCASDLSYQLDPVELRAVILHERHHQMDHAPARLILLEAVAWPLERVALGRGWLARARAQIEIAADRYALTAGATRADLASALLKLGDQKVPVGLAGYAASSELRLRALLGDPPERIAHRGPIIVSALVAGSAFLVCLVA